MIDLLHQYRTGERVWHRGQSEYGVVASKPGQVTAGYGENASPRYVVLFPGHRRLYAHPNELEPAAQGTGYLRLATVGGRAV